MAALAGSLSVQNHLHGVPGGRQVRQQPAPLTQCMLQAGWGIEFIFLRSGCFLNADPDPAIHLVPYVEFAVMDPHQ